MSFTNGKDIMVFVETNENEPVKVALEVIAEASKLAKGENVNLVGLVIGEDTEKTAEICAKAGVNKVIVVKEESKDVEILANIISEIAKKYDPSLLLMGATLIGKDLAAVVAKKCETACVTDVNAISIDGDEILFTAPVYGGTLLNDVVIKAEGLKMATIRPGSFKKDELSEETAEIIEETVNVPKDLKTVIKDIIKEAGESVNLEEAEIVVVGGRGMGNKENFELIHELAKVVGGVVGGTRPVTEDGWISRSQQVGQSGKIVTPKLYIGAGVSGAIQHLSGITGSDYIVAINKDEDAQIFDVADVGIVGDAMKVLPLMIEAIKKIKEEN